MPIETAIKGRVKRTRAAQTKVGFASNNVRRVVGKFLANTAQGEFSKSGGLSCCEGVLKGVHRNPIKCIDSNCSQGKARATRSIAWAVGAGLTGFSYLIRRSWRTQVTR